MLHFELLLAVLDQKIDQIVSEESSKICELQFKNMPLTKGFVLVKRIYGNIMHIIHHASES